MKSLLKKVYRKIFPYKPPVNFAEVKKYREFDAYTPDLVVQEAFKIHIPAKLPSEPPEGITYEFGPSGYFGSEGSDCCVIPTTWRNPNNYCHWNFSELPFLFLAFESPARNIILPDVIVEASLPFQKRWMDLLSSLYPDKKVSKLSESGFPAGALIPVNHDTSASIRPVGKCTYKHYHHSRATPYLIDRISKKYKAHFNSGGEFVKRERIYINRDNRRLKNEPELHELLKRMGFEIVSLEKLSLDEQVFMFSNAGVVVGFHGAGLSNLIYSESRTRVLEIADKDCVYPCYLDGHIVPGKQATRTYFHMLCEMKGLPYEAIESHDYFLDLEAFEEKLSGLMRG